MIAVSPGDTISDFPTDCLEKTEERQGSVMTAAKKMVPPKNSNHIVWVDLFKAICIVSMVLGHAGAPFTTYIYLFHMPAFMFISGYTYRGEGYSFLGYLGRKTRNILLPMLLINCIYIVFYVAMQKAGLYHYLQAGAPMGLKDRLKLLFLYCGTPDFGGATWFLVVLFTIEIVARICTGICGKIGFPKADAFLLLLPAAAGWYFISHKIVLPYLLDLSLFGCLFYAAGILTRRGNLLEKKIDHRVMISLSGMTTVFFGSFYFRDQIPMNWPTRQFAASLFIQLASCFSAMYLCYPLAKAIALSEILQKIFSYIGKHTYCILTTHFFIFRCIFLVLVLLRLLPSKDLQNLTPPYSPYPFWLFMTVAAVGGCMLLAWLSEKNDVLNYIVNARWTYRRRGKAL